MSCTSRCQHLWLSNFYTYNKNLIPAILNLLIFGVSIHNLDTVTGQDITNLDTVIGQDITNLDTVTGQDITNSKSLFIVSYKFCFVITFLSHMRSIQRA